MRTKVGLGALAVATGFFAAPVLAQTSGQSGSSMPGMSMSSPSQPGQQAQGGGMCGCCQRMAMNQQQQQGEKEPRP